VTQQIDVTARRAVADDLAVLMDLYRKLEAEMDALRGKWRIADGLAEPVDQAMAEAIEDQDTRIYIGEVDGIPFGFIFGRSEELLPQADGRRVAAIRMVFTEEPARGVGVGEVMRDTLMADFADSGHRLFDAHVLPGHRLAKNFFEAGGFSARSIVMHHDADRER
jgi:GNAT superfamily N-acetyltransferase